MVYSYGEPEILARFVEAPGVYLLSWITFNARIGDEGVRLLASSPAARRLENLSLLNNGLTADGAAVVASGFENLRDLNLGRNRIGDPGVQALCRSTTLSNLHTLRLYSVGIGPDGIAAFARSEPALSAAAGLPALRYLDLGWNHLPVPTIEAFDAATGLAELENRDCVIRRWKTRG